MRAWILVPLALALIVPAAAAQAPMSRVTIDDLPTTKMHMKIPSEHPMSFGVTLRLENLVCTSNAEATVSLKEDSAPMDGVMLHFKATTLKFVIPQGAYQSVNSATAPPYSSKQTSEFTVMVDETAPGDHGHTFALKAELPSGTPTNCQASAAVPAASNMGSHDIHLMPRPALSNATETAAGGGAGGAAQAEGSSPGPEALVLLGVFVAGAWALRRRRD